MVSFEHVSKFILSDIVLHIPKGVAVGVIGASGAGKTTLLKLACGLLSPEQGEVTTFNKNPIQHRGTIGRKIGCLLERMPVLDAEYSVADNFKNLQIVYQMSDAEFATEYDALAERFAIKAYEQLQVKALSLGQRRRAELVAVLLHRPELLLLDEPTNALDENAKNTLKEILQERMEQGMTVLLTSHDMQAVSGICRRLVVLEQGKLLYYGEEALLLRTYAPMDIMTLSFDGAVPDMEDLPLEKFSVEEDVLTLTYNSNYVTAAELLEVLLKYTTVREVSIHKPKLEDVIFAIEEGKREEKDELY